MSHLFLLFLESMELLALGVYYSLSLELLDEDLLELSEEDELEDDFLDLR